MSALFSVLFLCYGAILGFKHGSIIEVLSCFLCSGVFTIAYELNEINKRHEKIDNIINSLLKKKE